MKKALFSILMSVAVLTGTASVLSLRSIVTLQVGITDPTSVKNPFPKTPAHAPSVWLDGHELSFPSEHPLYTLTLLHDGEEVFTTIVTEGTGAIALPLWLSGEYELHLFPEGSSFYYVGIIDL